MRPGAAWALLGWASAQVMSPGRILDEPPVFADVVSLASVHFVAPPGTDGNTPTCSSPVAYRDAFDYRAFGNDTSADVAFSDAYASAFARRAFGNDTSADMALPVSFVNDIARRASADGPLGDVALPVSFENGIARRASADGPLGDMPPLFGFAVHADTAPGADRALPPAEAHRFGRLVDVDIDIARDGEWSVSPDGRARTWHAAVQSPGAHSISLRFGDLWLPRNAELYVVGVNRTLGAFVGAVGARAGGEFATAPVEGDTLVLSLWHVAPPAPAVAGLTRAEQEAVAAAMAADEDARAPRLRVTALVHGWEDPYAADPAHRDDSEACHVDAGCGVVGHTDAALHDAARAVGLLITDDGTRRCTGTLLNNARADGRPLFLTADHCVPRGRPATTAYIVAFNWQRRVCGERAGDGAHAMQTVHGLRLLARGARTDYALLEVLEPIPPSYRVHYAGWSRAPRAPRNVACVHHPQGDFKKVAHAAGRARLAAWAEHPARMHWAVDGWTAGGTQRGSSGAPLFRLADGLLVGHLHGGTSSCAVRDGRDLFGALLFDWHGARRLPGADHDAAHDRRTRNAHLAAGAQARGTSHVHAMPFESARRGRIPQCLAREVYEQGGNRLESLNSPHTANSAKAFGADNTRVTNETRLFSRTDERLGGRARVGRHARSDAVSDEAWDALDIGLAPFLDPDNLGVLELGGADYAAVRGDDGHEYRAALRPAAMVIATPEDDADAAMLAGVRVAPDGSLLFSDAATTAFNDIDAL